MIEVSNLLKVFDIDLLTRLKPFTDFFENIHHQFYSFVFFL